MAKANDGVTKMCCVLALFLGASVATAQAPPVAGVLPPAKEVPAAAPEAAAPALSPQEKPPASPPKITFVGGQLRIDALDLTLQGILAKVAALTAVKIEIPPEAASERMPIVKLGPGSARQVLAALLSMSNFDFLIQASTTDPEGIQSVMLLPREKKGSGGVGPELASRTSPILRGRAMISPSAPEETPEPVSPPPTQPDTPPADASSSAPPPASPSAPPDKSALSQFSLSPAALSNKSGLTNEGAMNPPATLDQQSISQQLLQMYQGRAQMGPQVRQPAQVLPPVTLPPQ